MLALLAKVGEAVLAAAAIEASGLKTIPVPRGRAL
jgi:hypothetical protein